MINSALVLRRSKYLKALLGSFGEPGYTGSTYEQVRRAVDFDVPRPSQSLAEREDLAANYGNGHQIIRIQSKTLATRHSKPHQSPEATKQTDTVCGRPKGPKVD